MTHRRAAKLAVTMLALSLSARADEGRIPIHGSIVITQPGHYLLTRNVAGQIAVQTSGVVIDLGGHTLTVPAGQPGIGANVFATRLTVVNGRIQGGAMGIYVYSGAGTALTIEDVDVSGVTDSGVHVLGDASRVRIARSRVASAGSGIVVSLTGTNAPIVEVEEVAVQNVGADGIQLSGGTARVSRCTVRQFGTNWTGISLQNGKGAVIEDNQVSGPGTTGIALAAATSGAIVRGNNVSGAAQHGILVGGSRHVVEGNQLEGSGGCGIFINASATSAYRDNMLRGNAGGAVCGTATDGGGNIL